MRLHLHENQYRLTIEVHRDGGNSYRVKIDGTTYTAEAQYLDSGTLLLILDGRRYRVAIARSGRERLVSVAGETHVFAPDVGATADAVESVASPMIVAPMPGKVLQVLVQAGDRVAPGDALLILEAMKMETRLVAEGPGTIAEVHVAAGDMVDGGQLLVVLRYEPTSQE